jgi:hypothetical protein
MRGANLAFAIALCGLLCPDCLPQTNSSPSTTERAAAPGTGNTGQSAPAVQSLELKETIPLAYPSPEGFLAGIKCDRDGNIFVPLAVFNSNGTARDSVLLEVLPDSKSTKTFGSQPLSGSEYPNQSIEYFDVDAGGTVYALVQTYENREPGDTRSNPQYFIERFNTDGSTDSVVHLDYPPGAGAVELDVSSLGVFGDGDFILAGAQWEASATFQPFIAVYSSDGRFIRRVALPDDVPGDRTLKAEHASSSQRDAALLAVTGGSTVSSPDGNVYLLRNSWPVRLYGIDSAGEVVKHFQLSPPSPGMDVSSMGLAGKDSLLLFFGHPPPQQPDEKLIPISQSLVGVFNTVSGQLDAVYKMPPKGFRIPACGDQHGGLLYIGNVGNVGSRHLAVFDYGP